MTAILDSIVKKLKKVKWVDNTKKIQCNIYQQSCTNGKWKSLLSIK